MSAKLTAITPSYRSFKDDQVLTAKQLNELLNYFDDQDRISRVFLSGVGIGCGFNQKMIVNSVISPLEKQIEISQGFGVTTDGDLLLLSIPSIEPEVENDEENINISKLVYKTFIPYSDARSEYKPFFYTNSGGDDEQITLFELLTEEEGVVPGAQKLNTFVGLEDMIVLLYLESYPQEPSVCTGVSCDNMGTKEVQKLRALLVSRTDVLNIIQYDEIFNYQNILSVYVQLPDVLVPRVLINQLNTQSPAELSNSYTEVITSTNIVASLKTGFELMLEKLGLGTLATEIKNQLDINFNSLNAPTYFQYWYDLLKDVTDTYNEMKDLFPDALCGCDPEITSFPKHLLLGPLKDLTESDLQFNNYRHSFLKSPLLSDFCSSSERFENLAYRLLEMLKANQDYQFPTTPVRITPSKTDAFLGNKAIPFYYDLNERLLKLWNYDKTARHKQQWNLSYHINQLALSPMVQTPLRYDLESYNFFRIEGHQGNPISSARNTIKSLRDTNGLNFELIDLGITLSPNETINIQDYPCEFADLQVLLDTWRQQNACILANASKFLSAYSVRTPWRNPRLPFYYEIKGKENVELRRLSNRSPEQNIVLENMFKEDGSIGKYISDAYMRYIGCSANDMINLVLAEMSGVNFGVFSPFSYDLTILKPVQTLSNALFLFDSIPIHIHDLDRNRLNNLMINSSNICVLARQTTGVINGDVSPTFPPISTPGNYFNVSPLHTFTPVSERENIEEFPGSFNYDYSKDFEVTRITEKAPAMIPNIMEDLIKYCCNIKQIETILTEIERRKNKIILHKKLSEFVKNHPGLEHFGGVKTGGTFVLVYTSEPFGEIPANTVLADFSLPYSCNCTCEI